MATQIAVRLEGRALAALVAAVATLGASSACGNAITTDVNGMTGLTVDDSGRPLLVAELCDGVVAGLTVAGPNRGTEPNEVRADLTTNTAVDASFVVDLGAPPGEWSGQPLALPVAEDTNIAYAHGGDRADSQLSQVTFTRAEVAQLRPGTVQYGSHEPGEPAERTDTAGFADVACPAD